MNIAITIDNLRKMTSQKTPLVVPHWFDGRLFLNICEHLRDNPEYIFLGKEDYSVPKTGGFLESMNPNVDPTIEELAEKYGDKAIEIAHKKAKDNEASLILLWTKRGYGQLDITAHFYNTIYDHIKFVNLLTKKKEDIKLNQVIQVNKNNQDFIISNPHSGAFVPNRYIDDLIVNEWLFRSFDIYTDEVYDVGRDSGTQLYNLINRYIANLNKSLFDVEPISGQVYLNNSPSLKREISEKERDKIIRLFYIPYHNTLKNLIKQMKDAKGFALIIDGHSMNSVGLEKTFDPGKQRPDFSIGTRLDSSCERKISDYLCLQLNQEFSGLKVWKNKPYKGGSITRNYGRPETKINVIQIELKRALYMDENTFEKHSENLHELNEGLLRAIRNTAQFAQDFYKS